MRRIDKTAPTEAVGCIIDSSREAKKGNRGSRQSELIEAQRSIGVHPADFAPAEPEEGLEWSWNET